jgi:endoglucanase
MPLNIDYGVNTDLVGLTAIQVMDKIIDGCGARGLKVILDYHRIVAGGTPEWGLWYDAGHPESTWIANWQMLVTRYLGNTTVIGCDLFNEVHADAGHPGPFWDADGLNEPYNWRTAAKRAADAIQAINPDLLICVQGLHAYNGQSGWWGAVHLGVADHPLVLSVPNRLVYSVHDYGPIVWEQPWLNDVNFPNNLPAHWDTQWGFLHNNNVAPVWVGEWGAMLDPAHPKYTRELQWLTALRDYIQAKGLVWTWWTWTPNSGDTGGILKNDWQTVEQGKMDVIGPAMYAGFSPPGGGPPPPPPPPVGGAPSGSSDEGCGLLGAEVLLLLAVRGWRRRRAGQ